MIIAILLVFWIMFQVYALLSDFCIFNKTWSYMIMRNKTKALNPWNVIHFELVKRKICKSHLSIKVLFNTYTTPPMIFLFIPPTLWASQNVYLCFFIVPPPSLHVVIFLVEKMFVLNEIIFEMMTEKTFSYLYFLKMSWI